MASKLVERGLEKSLLSCQVNLLLSGGACVNTPSSDRFTPLLSACSRGFGQAESDRRGREDDRMGRVGEDEEPLVVSLLLVVRPGAPSSVLCS